MRTADPCAYCGTPCEHTFCTKRCAQNAGGYRRRNGIVTGLRAPNIIAILEAHPHPRRLERTVRELRTSGLSYGAISTVLSLYEAVDLSAEQVRDWCRRMGLPRNEAKARYSDERAAA